MALLREVISVDLSLSFMALPCFPPRMASKQEQQLPMIAIQVSGGVEAGRGAAVGELLALGYELLGGLAEERKGVTNFG